MEKSTDTSMAPMAEKPIYYTQDDDILFAAPPRIAAIDGKAKIVDLGICLMWCDGCGRNTVHESSRDGFVCQECGL